MVGRGGVGVGVGVCVGVCVGTEAPVLRHNRTGLSP